MRKKRSSEPQPRSSTSIHQGAEPARQKAARHSPPDGYAGGLAAGIAFVVLAGYLVPQPLSLANGTIVNQPLADALAAERERAAEISRLTQQLVDDPRDADILSRLADLYLAGSRRDDLVAAALSDALRDDGPVVACVEDSVAGLP